MRARILNTPDLYLHISVGHWILARHIIPDQGIFSGTKATSPWLAHEWLASLGIAEVYDQLGWFGLMAATAISLALAIGIVVYNVARAAGPSQALVCGLLAWGLCLGHTLARPHIFTLPLFALWIAAHVGARRDNTAPPVALALLMIVWVNLHGSFLIGPAITVLFMAEAMYEAEIERRCIVGGCELGIVSRDNSACFPYFATWIRRAFISYLFNRYDQGTSGYLRMGAIQSF